MKQSQMILNHLKKDSITPLEALKEYGCFRLSGIIFKLKQSGYNIKTEIINHKSKKYGKKYFAKYSLIK